MDRRIRTKELVDWLMYTKKYKSQKELSEIIGYSPTVLCSVLTGRIPCSNKLISMLCSQDKRINKGWVLTGEGDMLNEKSESPRQDDSKLDKAYELISYLVKEGGKPLLDKAMHSEHAMTLVSALYIMSGKSESRT